MSYSIASTVSTAAPYALPKLSQGSVLLVNISKVAFAALSCLSLSLQALSPLLPVIVHMVVGLTVTLALLYIIIKAPVLDTQYIPLEPARCCVSPHIHVTPSYSHFERSAPVRYMQQPTYIPSRPSFSHPSVRTDRVGERRSF